ncbi:MAG: fibronectin type III domain-containing protein [bacterium]|nr:fibronectin type III domain-containing protein [bacterium]
MKKYIASAILASGLVFLMTASVAQAGCSTKTQPCVWTSTTDRTSPDQGQVNWSASKQSQTYYGGTKNVDRYIVEASTVADWSKEAKIFYTGSFNDETYTTWLTSKDGINVLDEYFVRVREKYDDGTKSMWSDTAMFRSGVPIVKNVRLTSRKKKSVEVTWTPTAALKDAGPYYHVKVFKNNKTSDDVLLAEETLFIKDSLAIKNLKSGKKYYVRITAKKSPFSDSDMVKFNFRTK